VKKKSMLTLAIFFLSACNSGQKNEYLDSVARKAYENGKIDKAERLVSERPRQKSMGNEYIRLHLLLRKKNLCDADKINEHINNIETLSKMGDFMKYDIDNDVHMYREYLRWLNGDKTFMVGVFPEKPKEKACEKRISDVQDAFGVGTWNGDYLYIEKLEWFSRYIRDECGTNELDAILVASAADGGVDHGKDAYQYVTSNLSEDEKLKFTDALCGLKRKYMWFPEKSGISKLENAGIIAACPSPPPVQRPQEPTIVDAERVTITPQ
jgi:uncharacterized protein YneR